MITLYLLAEKPNLQIFPKTKEAISNKAIEICKLKEENDFERIDRVSKTPQWGVFHLTVIWIDN